MMRWIVFLLMIFSFPAFAWNNMGHRIIGEIAYEHLDIAAKNKANQLIDYLSDAYPYSSNFQTANSWADYIKQDGLRTFDSWHFYNKPYSIDNSPIETPKSQNLIWAINQSISVLKNPNSNQFEKAFFLRFLLHLTGDAHQPLHCIDLFSKSFPYGDEGGNLFLTHNENYYNLHAYWDDGLGLFNKRCGFSSSKTRRVDCLAAQIEKNYPESYFGNKTKDLDPEDWVDQSYSIAKDDVYQTPENQTLSNTYIKNNQQIVEQQTALAGYRLANVLNNILGQ